MGGELVPKDLRHFFFQVIDVGKKIGIFSEVNLANLRKEGAEMTIELAGRHYTLVSQAHVWQSAYNVAGVLSLGLVEKFKADPEKAARFVKEKGLIPAFQHGWGLILKLKSLANFLPNDIFKKDRVERELCEYFMADPHDRKWEGQKKFKELATEALWAKRLDDWRDWAISAWAKKKDKELSWLESDEWLSGALKMSERKQDIINTFFFSLLLEDTPFAPFGEKEIKKIRNLLVKDENKKSEAIIAEKITETDQMVPLEFRACLKADAKNFIKKTLPKLKKLLKNSETELAGLTWMGNYLFIKNNPFSIPGEDGTTKKRRQRKKKPAKK